jgi:predicted HTH domain antitoxin
VTLAIELDIPDNALTKDAQTELVQSVKEQTALRLLAEHRVTTGEASRMLGITRVQLLDLLNRSGVGFQVELDEDDFAMLRQWQLEHPGKSSCLAPL